MKKKHLKILLCALLLTVIVSIFSMTVFAAGDVASAIESTWTAAQSQIKTVVNNVVFPVVDMILAILFLHILITASMDSLNSQHLPYCSPALFSLLQHHCIFGLFSNQLNIAVLKIRTADRR